MIQGVLFDMDGLMFDTERIGYEGWKYAGKKLGIHMKDELIASFRGTGEKEKRSLQFCGNRFGFFIPCFVYSADVASGASSGKISISHSMMS